MDRWNLREGGDGKRGAIYIGMERMRNAGEKEEESKSREWRGKSVEEWNTLY